MRVTIFQPPYPAEESPEASQECIEWVLQELQAIHPGTTDWIVLPEYVNAPGLNQMAVAYPFVQRQQTDTIATFQREARRTGASIAAGVIIRDGTLWRNRCILLSPEGEEIGHYDKVHLTSAEQTELGLTPGNEIPALQIGSNRIGFATCFDLYFPEHFSTLASRAPDIILSPCYQRSESPARIRLLAGTRALDSGAYLIRSSYSTGDPDRGGHSLIASPTGEIVLDCGDAPGVSSFVIEPTRKFVKPASHGHAPREHRELIESHRKPLLYRTA